ncbi:MAG: MMPL family transporter [Chloroflexi bacterium]|nr:MMPL family transporter [Chloroflexota bacterium]
MTDPFARLGAAMVRWRWLVLAVWILAIAVGGGALASRANDVVKGGGFVVPGSDSALAAQILETDFNASTRNNAVIVFRSDELTVDSPAFAAEVVAATQRLEALDGVEQVFTLYNTGAQSLASEDRRTTIAIAPLEGDEGRVQELVPEVREQLEGLSIEHHVTGLPAVNYDTEITAEEDLLRAERITIPVALILVLLVFRTIVASSLPLVLGISGVVMGFSLVYLVGLGIDTSVFALNVASMIGLALGIDFSFIVVSRYREERQAGREVGDAVAATMATAGRSITYSGITVILAMLVLTAVLSDLMIVRSISLGVLLVAVTSLIAGLTLLPALLAILGDRIEMLRVIPRGRQRPAGEQGFWYRFSHLIMRRPWVWLLGALAVMLFIASPARNLDMVGATTSVLPADTDSVQGAAALEQALGANRLTPIQIVMKADNENGVWTPTFLNSLKELTDVLAADQRAEEVTSLSTMLWNVPDFEYPNITASYFRPAPESPDPSNPFLLPDVPGVTLETLISADVSGPPHPPAFAGTGRFTLQPGQGVQAASAPAVDVIRVMDGTLSIQANGETTLTRGVTGGANDRAEAVPAGTRFSLNAGDQLVVPMDVPIDVQNEGAQPVTAIVITMFVIRTSPEEAQSAWTVGEPSTDRFAGITRQVLSGGTVVELPRGRAHIQMDRVIAAPGAFLMRHTHTGPEMFYVESGEFTVFSSDQMTILTPEGKTEEGLPYDTPVPIGSGGKAMVQSMGIHRAVNNTNVDAVIYSTRIYDGDLPPFMVVGAAQEAAQFVNLGGSNDAAVITVISRFGQYEDEHQSLVFDLRERIAPEILRNGGDFEVFVGGDAASFLDFRDSLYGRFPIIVAAVAAMIFIILMMFFQSVYLPIKAMFMNLVSVLATYGILVVIFQYGWGTDLLGFESQGLLNVVTPAILFVILFALSTDYEVFVLSRVKEYYHGKGDNEEAVALGLDHTAGVVTAAGLILIGTFGSFAAANVVTIKEIGLGLAIGILIDTTIVRVIMVPATMRLMGALNWWMPAWLKRIVPELSEGPAPAMGAAADAQFERKYGGDG